MCYVGLSVYVQWNSNVDAWKAIRDEKESLFVPGRGWEDELPIGSGQIIATSHDRFPPKGSGGFRKSPYFGEI